MNVRGPSCCVVDECNWSIDQKDGWMDGGRAACLALGYDYWYPSSPTTTI